jgi:DNA helicase HerA-like ATPase
MPATADPGATSVDGRHFDFLVSPDLLEVPAGGYLVLDHPSGPRLGQVTGIGLARDGAGSAARAHVEGRVLEGPAGPFDAARPRAARAEEVAAWLDAASARPPRASLEVGTLAHAPELPLALDAGAFDRHTFLCGQSGSGKTYALGTILERLLVETSLRILVLDPNSDFVRLDEVREGTPPEIAARYTGPAAGVAIRRSGADGSTRLHVRFRDFDADEQAAVLRLDPIADREEYAALAEAVEAAAESGLQSVEETVERLCAQPEPLRSLGLRARNLGVDRWQIWSGHDPGSLEELVQPGGPRCVVADLGSLATRAEQAVAAEAALAALWRRRGAREPVLIVIDEAHNVCPGQTTDHLTEIATEHAVRIAGEGRKFGLVLLVSTQRPQKVHENVLSQCDNLVLMRMNSRSDLAAVSETFSFVPQPLLSLATDFRQGEAIVAGKLVAAPMVGRFGPRWSVEGGADIASDWAAPPR